MALSLHFQTMPSSTLPNIPLSSLLVLVFLAICCSLQVVHASIVKSPLKLQYHRVLDRFRQQVPQIHEPPPELPTIPTHWKLMATSTNSDNKMKNKKRNQGRKHHQQATQQSRHSRRSPPAFQTKKTSSSTTTRRTSMATTTTTNKKKSVFKQKNIFEL